VNALASFIALHSCREGVDLMQIELLINVRWQLGKHACGNLLVGELDLLNLSLGRVVVIHVEKKKQPKNRSVS
jgi:hypothetical protein